MQKMKHPHRLLLLSLLPVLFGCSGPPKPDGLPDRTPFVIIVTQEGEPLVEAMVQLVSPDVRWSITGNTDTKGTAKMVTHGRFEGVPPGFYKVVVTKTETEETLSTDSKKKTLKVFSLVDPRLGHHSTSLLEVEVAKTVRSTTLDVGRSVRELIDTAILPVSDDP